ncbi:NAD(P)-dependent oxidoreductase [Pseudoroseomonas wenyumeiae]|uniref:NAD(P)-dependent oxidoreductase n=1 Tax=Teichococcus wenyumeiae TaxID=2478470 RepID=A0A3A9JCF1_9PROT|nr:NAD(P)-dependent oxidoreductase [Pseudoroseomonas wenyumeiae]RKK03830.1 NAD(P)-dependent oxidoreductase [Pseudoroseomonas wenyumeiae]RMI16912.1 NAD(P)-dependent oxidoreductase [Pseudoroseomonas wenyumeiae]
MARIGFIGLGTMGRGMAANLIAAGHALHVHDVRREAMEEFSARGATVAGSVAEAARNAEAVVLMLPDTPQVEEVVLGPGGLVENPPAGRLVIDMSTISAAASRSMAARLEAVGTAMLDAPVSGGPQGAESGSLSIMAGGTKAGFAAAQPILTALGTTVRHVGPPGAGQTVKACNQLICALNLQAICEALALGRAAGLDLELLREVLLGGAASSWMLQNLGPKMIARDAGAGFRIDLKLKDLRLAGELGFQHGLPLPGLALATSLYLEARAHGEGANGNQALFRVYDRLTNQAGEVP